MDLRMRGFVAKGGAVEAAGMGEVVEKEGVPVEDVVSASEGRGGRGRRRGVVELKRAAGGVRLKLMARGWKFLGNAKPVAAESCARMRGPSQHFERSKSRLASIRGKLRAALFCMSAVHSLFTQVPGKCEGLFDGGKVNRFILPRLCVLPCDAQSYTAVNPT